MRGGAAASRPSYAEMRGATVGPEVYVELMQLIARYSIARDDQDVETLLDTMSADARFERRGVVIEGRDELRRFYGTSIERSDWTSHTTHMALFHQVDDDHVGGVVTGHAELVRKGVMHQASYRYRDEYARIEGRFVITSRELAFLYIVPVADLGGPMGGPDRIRWAGTAPELADFPETLPTWRGRDFSSPSSST